jgi:HD-GYP domain-containing protein (c-di-GMP phosphodiesterase class II)
MNFPSDSQSFSKHLKKKLYISDKQILTTIQSIVSQQDIEVLYLQKFQPDTDQTILSIFLISSEYYGRFYKEILEFGRRKSHYNALMYYAGDTFPEDIHSEYIDVFILKPVNKPYLLNVIKNGFDTLQKRIVTHLLNRELAARTKQVQEFSNIGRQLMMEKDLLTLLNRILYKCREVTNADAGSIYLVEETENGNKQLRFMITQNDSVSFDFKEVIMPISRKSISGFVADTGKMLNIEDVYHLPEHSEFSFNKSFDEKVGYRTKSMLVIPLRNHVDEIIGVLQLINCKTDFAVRLKTPADADVYVLPFTGEYIEMVTSLAAQAAISIENNLLYRNIEQLFEGFVSASVTAIESRDPTTSGHSSRVALLTENLAKTINQIHSGPMKDIKFTQDQLKELRYASLLHDFGKVGVREQVLLKAKKLYPYQLNEILYRINHLKQQLEIEDLKKRIDFLLHYDIKNLQYTVSDLDTKLKKKLAQIDTMVKTIIEINEPAIVEDDKVRFIDEIAKTTFIDTEGTEKPLLEENELKSLHIKRGSLSEEECLEIESHVIHTYNFLSKVPWTKDIKNIPQIAYAHHEKLNGEGYPNKLSAEAIPIQPRMIAISDIFDALTASDRPYKKAVPFDRALQILQYEVNDNHIDKNLLNIFIEKEIYNCVLK